MAVGREETSCFICARSDLSTAPAPSEIVVVAEGVVAEDSASSRGDCAATLDEPAGGWAGHTG